MRPTTIRDVPHICVIDQPLRKIGGRWHVEISIESVQPGDYVFYDSTHGRRCRRVSKVVRRRGRTAVHVAPLLARPTRTVLERGERLDLQDVKSAWRRASVGGSQ